MLLSNLILIWRISNIHIFQNSKHTKKGIHRKSLLPTLMGGKTNATKYNPEDIYTPIISCGTTDVLTLFIIPKITFSFELQLFQSSQNRKHLDDKTFTHECQKGDQMVKHAQVIFKDIIK